MMMSMAVGLGSDGEEFPRGLGGRVLRAEEERSLIDRLTECRGRRDRAATPAEAEALGRRCDELRSELALANLRLVVHIAAKFRHRGLALADLIQEGYCGLLVAIDRFDPGRSNRLSTYATWYIRLAMQRAVAAGAYAVRLNPQQLRDLHSGQREPGAGPAPTGRKAEQLRRLAIAVRPAVPIDPSCDYGHFPEAPDDPTNPPADPGAALARLWPALRPREQEVLAHRFGLDGRPRRTLVELSRMLDVSRERVRQLQNQAIRKLRAAAEADPDGVFGAGN